MSGSLRTRVQDVYDMGWRWRLRLEQGARRLWAKVGGEDGDVKEVLIVAGAVVLLALLVLFGRKALKFIEDSFNEMTKKDS